MNPARVIRDQIRFLKSKNIHKRIMEGHISKKIKTDHNEGESEVVGEGSKVLENQASLAPTNLETPNEVVAKDEGEFIRVLFYFFNVPMMERVCSL
ncbi:hypothetical protein AX774_g2443 [Zancudomyces culisetae]|uniref:Uncharacterized protein n=1 Tax=Zancudomyces culisetae TaxID=1213189 RepID=A0A1R1PT13_ZANCU|nr:hypothetical protein AX774_g2443 [Zancudomyces culisetae]|eukprot:OMH84043.1 hypothetical protein AX774_g2443 [Zancudomyces culisetae]